MPTNQWDTYADVFDRGLGSGGDTLHVTIIHPLIQSYIGTDENHDILDVGCGNGYIVPFLGGFTSYTGIDGSVKLLSKAKKRNTTTPHVRFIHADIETVITLGEDQFDIALCNMVLQYVSSLDTIVQSLNSLVKPGGIVVVIIDHPAHSLWVRAQTLTGNKDDKFIDLASYFKPGKRLKNSLWGKATLTYFHRTIADYINPFTRYFHPHSFRKYPTVHVQSWT
jgi:SAM-dependent methyltransferase